jgi:hypothetical protein
MRVTRPVDSPEGEPSLRGGQLNPLPRTTAPLEGGDHLAITISVLTVLTVTVIVLCRYAGLRIFHALICVLLGFYLASSQFAPAIQRVVANIIRLL